MDLLHGQLAALQRHLAFVAVDPIDWKFFVQACSWSVCLFESYLLCAGIRLPSRTRDLTRFFCFRIRQYPLYSKTEPPPVLKDHFSQEVFDKSQKYGKDKAKFALASGLYRQVVDSAMLQYGMYAWAWEAGGRFLTKVGYSTEHEVSKSAHDTISLGANEDLA